MKGNIIYVNDGFCKASKYERKELIGKHYNIIRHPETPTSLLRDMWESVKLGETWQGEIKNRAKEMGKPKKAGIQIKVDYKSW